MSIEVSLVPGFIVGFTWSPGYVELGLGIVYILFDWSEDGPR
jgi:hypothetical protein